MAGVAVRGSPARPPQWRCFADIAAANYVIIVRRPTGRPRVTFKPRWGGAGRGDALPIRLAAAPCLPAQPAYGFILQHHGHRGHRVDALAVGVLALLAHLQG